MNSISIITICFNNLADLRATCKSIEQQQVLPFEHIIINGSTTQDIKNWMENSPQPVYRKWVNERDKGIADAFNKGIRAAEGSITYLLNSGDLLHDPSVLGKVEQAFNQDPSLMWCHGKLKLFRGDQWVLVGKSFEKKKLYRGMRSVFHPTMFVNKEVYNRRGYFDTDLKIAMDYDFLCRIADEKFIFLNEPIAVFDPTGVSSEHYEKALNEASECYRKYYGSSWKQSLWNTRQIILHRILNSAFGKKLYALKVKLGGENW
jgi:glycosyltransferase involved in cell wall biosynthesis